MAPLPLFALCICTLKENFRGGKYGSAALFVDNNELLHRAHKVAASREFPSFDVARRCRYTVNWRTNRSACARCVTATRNAARARARRPLAGKNVYRHDNFKSRANLLLPPHLPPPTSFYSSPRTEVQRNFSALGESTYEFFNIISP